MTARAEIGVFGGSGFYSTDNRSRKALSPSTKDKDGGSDGSSSDKSKPAEKKETKAASKKDSGGGAGSQAS